MDNHCNHHGIVAIINKHFLCMNNLKKKKNVHNFWVGVNASINISPTVCVCATAAFPAIPHFVESFI